MTTVLIPRVQLQLAALQRPLHKLELKRDRKMVRRCLRAAAKSTAISTLDKSKKNGTLARRVPSVLLLLY